ncbi:hypothetical protein, partial [Roseiconus lacunae]|uniref:hypothetical protein n=1 Tax=Roseiconus lacunae TaxID=2605694 RepID=UPI001E53CF7B
GHPSPRNLPGLNWKTEILRRFQIKRHANYKPQGALTIDRFPNQSRQIVGRMIDMESQEYLFTGLEIADGEIGVIQQQSWDHGCSQDHDRLPGLQATAKGH